MTNNDRPTDFSVVIPCFNEEDVIVETIEQLHSALGNDCKFECIVINDGSTDRTEKKIRSIEARFSSLRIINLQQNSGYGAALKVGVNAAQSDLIAITDADGTYPLARLKELVDLCADKDMVVGARTGENVSYSKLRALPKYFLTRWVSWIVQQKVPDINSGMRVFRKEVAQQYMGILPDGFSFTITITLAMLTNKQQTLFVPIDYHPRVGQSKIRPIQDTLRFISIIARTAVYFAPLRVFVPIMGVLLLLGTISLVSDIMIGNLTDKTVLLFITAMNAGMFGMLADMMDKRLK